MAWLILVRVILSVSANAVQKRLLLDRAGVYHTWILTYSFIFGPALLLAFFRSSPLDWQFGLDIATGGSLDALGNLAMVAALRSTDISVFGPLNALRPILALLFGWLFLGEYPTSLGMVGVAITVAGGVILFSDTESHATARWPELFRALALRTTGLSLGVIGAVFLKRAVLRSSAEVTVAAWIFCGLVVLLTASALHRPGNFKTIGAAARTHLGWLLVHGACFLSMQLLTMYIFRGTLLAYSFVYFQLGMVLQVFIGRMFFKEPAFIRRLVASAVMAFGSVLVLWKG
jgi:drug/metabolite transporter (DMT)-like permease